MPKRKEEPAKGPSVERKACERVMFGLGHARRFTQDSPILPDVWLKFAEDLDATCELLLTPYGEARPGEVRSVILERLEHDGKSIDDREVIYNQSTVLATLDFAELVRVVLPVTGWWSNALWQRKKNPRSRKTERVRITPLELRNLKAETIADALRDPERKASQLGLTPDLLWIFRTVGFLALARKERRDRTADEIGEKDTRDDRAGETTEVSEAKNNWLPEVRAVAELLEGVESPDPTGPHIWTVNLNRRATTTVYRSSVAVKADAARRLFEISCKDLVWAVVDSGIDATHPAFRLRQDTLDRNGSRPLYAEPFEKVNGKWENRTRIVATYDFRLIRQLLNPARLDPPSADLPPRVRELLAGKKRDPKLIEQLKQLKPRLISGNEIDWTLLEPLLEVPHDNRYTSEVLNKGKENERTGHIPQNDHGTHCAGILAADWRDTDEGRERQRTLTGICPDLRLYDLRVFDDDGMGDEFSIIAALQYIRYKNAHKDYFVVHGANLSMSIKHDVMNFACGRTPICEEAERLVNNGVVVVAAAGNEGYVKYETIEGSATEGYRSISITDPGNADLVITVGATHRFKPHTYGVSYFSSRGPTGDGRIKPDIVAPGEKIESVTPNTDTARKDGTSMATPHVSGAAALLMARYEELIGRPARIKKILTSTATDLGRERYFQGAGMVDILRALQSV
ncbi:MAG TPA: S8 family serine peptidase [Thermoanaerobaculia bacterium]|nr:S8 family serine peptidase [Thermoanaerobaculia bacterium]